MTQGPQSPLSGPEQQVARTSRKNRGDPSTTATTGTTAAASNRGNVDDTDTHSDHNCNVPSSSAVQTCCAPTCRQLHQPQHATRSEQQQPCQPQRTDNSKNGARNRATNAVAPTRAEDDLTIDFFLDFSKQIKAQGACRAWRGETGSSRTGGHARNSAFPL